MVLSVLSTPFGIAGPKVMGLAVTIDMKT